MLGVAATQVRLALGFSCDCFRVSASNLEGIKPASKGELGRDSACANVY